MFGHTPSAASLIVSTDTFYGARLEKILTSLMHLVLPVVLARKEGCRSRFLSLTYWISPASLIRLQTMNLS